MSTFPHKSTREIELSIVIISFNTVDMTRDCLNSVLENRGDLSCQIIVVDNNSQDGSVGMIESEFSDVEVIANKDNLGFAAANNQGFSICSGEYILLLNSDTLVLGNVLKESVSYMKSHNNVGAFGCRVLNTDNTLQRTCSMYPSILNLLLLTLALDRLPYPKWLKRYNLGHWARNDTREVDVVSGCYLLIPKRILVHVGDLDDSFFFFGEETDWCVRIRSKGWKVLFSPVGEIIHHGSVSAKKLKYKRDIMLTNGIVRLHLKHNGMLNALATWIILFAFNASRALIWSFLSIFSKRGRERAVHFSNVILHFRETWPSGR
ncbi:MAG: glycosyltransferase family 2 protein [Sneathiella sp.]